MPAMKDESAEIVKSGEWLYDGTSPYEVWIIKQNFEYWYEEGYDESERLNRDGFVFAVRYACNGVVHVGTECMTLEEAVAAAELTIPQGIQWNDHRLQPLFGGRKYRLQPTKPDDC